MSFYFCNIFVYDIFDLSRSLIPSKRKICLSEKVKFLFIGDFTHIYFVLNSVLIRIIILCYSINVLDNVFNKMSRKDKYESNTRRQQTFMSAEDVAAGRKSSWQGVEITGIIHFNHILNFVY